MAFKIFLNVYLLFQRKGLIWLAKAQPPLKGSKELPFLCLSVHTGAAETIATTLWNLEYKPWGTPSEGNRQLRFCSLWTSLRALSNPDICGPSPLNDHHQMHQMFLSSHSDSYSPADKVGKQLIQHIFFPSRWLSKWLWPLTRNTLKKLGRLVMKVRHRYKCEITESERNTLQICKMQTASHVNIWCV